MKHKMSFLGVVLLLLTFTGCAGRGNGNENTAQQTIASTTVTTIPVQIEVTEPVSNELNGVPEILVLASESCNEYLSDYRVDDYCITHNVDTVLHTDEVTIMLTQRGMYTDTTAVYTLLYQYYKSDDIWELMSYSDGYYSTLLKEESFITDAGWYGKHNNTSSIGYFNNEFYYMIYIDDIDMENMNISLRYEIEFTNENFESLTQTSPVTLPLEHFFGTSYAVRIDVEDLNTPFDSCIKFRLDENGFYEDNW